jgi:hypothetical protein
MTNGVKVYLFVAAYKVTGGTTYESPKAVPINEAPTPKWAETVYVLHGSGFSTVDLSAGLTYSSLASNAVTVADIFLDDNFYIRGCANDHGAMVFQTGQWTQTTKIKDMGVASYDDDAVSFAPTDNPSTWGDSAFAIEGHVYAIYTEEGNYVKLSVDVLNNVSGSTNDYMDITWGYQMRSGYTNFKAASK